MRWLIGIVLAVLVISVAGTTGGYLAESGRSTSTTRPAAPTPTPATTPGTSPGSAPPGSSPISPSPDSSAPVPGAPPAATFTGAQVAEHASTASCWLLIDGQVYDVTAYLGSHPGGARTITPWCGKEATEAFATEDGRGEHSPEAYDLLADYRIGALAS